jgi:hypothetical protein
MKRWIIIGILVLAAFLRLYNLSHVPPSPSLDEVSIGYNAYSILKTGADEYGTKFPILLRAYDDFRPALYVYLVIPFVWLLGLTVAAVRLPSVVLSLVTIWVTYKIGQLVGKKYLSFPLLGEIAAMFLAISPWHIYISRLGHEANIGLTLVTLAVYFFLSAVTDRNKRNLLLSGLTFGLSVHGYQSEKIITPVLLVLGGLLFRKELWKQKRTAGIAFALCVAIALPAAVATFSPQGMARFHGTSAFSPDEPRFVEAARQYDAAKAKGDRLGSVIHGKLMTSADVFLGNYVSHFSPSWLFRGGDREAFKAPGSGLLYVWESVFILGGLWALVKSKMPGNLKIFILAWILAAPVPASLTTQAPHAMRSFTFIPGLQLLEAFGAWYLAIRLNKNQRQIAAVLIGAVAAMGFTMFWNGYFIRFPAEQSDSFQYAMKDAVAYATAHTGEYTSVQFGNQGNVYQSYMFFLYYSRFDPTRYHELGGTRSGGFSEAHYFGKYAFGYLPRESAGLSPNTLYLYDAGNVPMGLRTRETFANLDGKPAIVAGTL